MSNCRGDYEDIERYRKEADRNVTVRLIISTSRCLIGTVYGGYKTGRLAAVSPIYPTHAHTPGP